MTITHDWLRRTEQDGSRTISVFKIARLARLVRLAIAADAGVPTTQTAQQAALREELIKEGLR